MKVPLITPPEPLPYSFVREQGHRFVHYAITYKLRALCTCLCIGPARQRRAGDTLCRCFCHGMGPKHTAALCGRMPVLKWSIVNKASAPVCQICHAEACKGPPPPPPPPPPPVPTCGAPCSFVKPPVLCLLPPNHYGLHISTGPGGKGKMSW